MSIVAQRIVIARVQLRPGRGITGVGVAWSGAASAAQRSAAVPPQGAEQSSLAIVMLLTQLRRVFRLDGRWALEGAR